MAATKESLVIWRGLSIQRTFFVSNSKYWTWWHSRKKVIRPNRPGLQGCMTRPAINMPWSSSKTIRSIRTKMELHLTCLTVQALSPHRLSTKWGTRKALKLEEWSLILSKTQSLMSYRRIPVCWWRDKSVDLPLRRRSTHYLCLAGSPRYAPGTCQN